MLSHQNQLLASAVMCFQDFSRLLFNFLRLSPNYSLVAQQGGNIRLHKHMAHDQRAAIECFRRYGDVAYFSPSWTAFQAERGRDFSVIVDGISN